jgi:hypothetical protein
LGGGQAATFGNTSYPIENAPSPFVCKINSAGQYEWVKTFGIGIVFNRRQDIKVDEQGNVYVYGLFPRSAFSSDNTNTQGYYLVKYNNNGGLIWAKEITIKPGINTGAEAAKSIGIGQILINKNLDVYITGSFNGDITFDNNTLTTSSPQVYLLKFNAEGKYIWGVRTGNGFSSIEPSALTMDQTGDIYVVGSYYGNGIIGSSSFTSTGDSDVFIAKYSEQGSNIWVKSVGASETIICNGSVADNTAIYLSGTFRGVAQFDKTMITAQTPPLNRSSFDVFVAKYDLNGALVWVKPFGGQKGDIAYKIAKQNDNLYVTGYFQENASFDGTALTAKNNLWEFFILKMNTEGSVQTVRQYDLKSGTITAVSVDQQENLYVSGRCESSITFDNTSLTSHGSGDILVAKTRLD